jgi:pSer/pThr/pTyr-binding forkhead associated (FHA) protein
VITCAKCGKDNQDHYKFCLGCGSELAKGASPKPFSADTPPHGVKAVSLAATAAAASAVAPTAPPVAAPKPEPVAPPPAMAALAAASAAAGSSAGAATVNCPQCGHLNSSGSRFCAACGLNLNSASSAAVPTSSAASSSSPAPSPGSSLAVRLTALRADGTEAGYYTLPSDDKVVLGRDTGSVFAGDSYLSPRHCSFSRQGGNLTVRDEGSLNGVYLKLKPEVPWPLNFGDILRIGQEIVKLEALDGQPPTADAVERLGSPKDGFVGRLALVIGRDTTGNAFPIPAAGVHCGRERGDILFSEDGYVSGLHCRIAPNEKGQLCLTDVGSSNGTFVRLTRDHKIITGDILLMGQQLFRVDIG